MARGEIYLEAGSDASGAVYHIVVGYDTETSQVHNRDIITISDACETIHIPVHIVDKLCQALKHSAVRVENGIKEDIK